MQIMVTGGSGYLGSILCRKLLDLDQKVTCIDTCLYGTTSIAQLMQNENFKLVKSDIRNLSVMAKNLKGIDAVIHLASIVGMPASGLDPESSFEINHLSTEILAKMAKNRGVKHFIFASSCSVYGSAPDEMITEKSQVNPLDNYAMHKFNSEDTVRHEFPFPTILRFGTLFGLSPRLRFDLVVNKFIAQALSNEVITVYGGDQFRPFLHVSDAADSIVFALNKELEGTFNVISENMTLKDLGKKISDSLHTEYKIVNENNDFRNYKVSMAKIHSFGFMPQKNLEFAIREFASFFDSNRVDWKLPEYSNYDSLLVKRISKKAFI